MLHCGPGVGASTGSCALRLMCALAGVVIGCGCNGNGVVKGSECSGSIFVLGGAVTIATVGGGDACGRSSCATITASCRRRLLRLVLVAPTVVSVGATIVVDLFVASSTGEARTFWWFLRYRL